jgi:hypothetical protein
MMSVWVWKLGVTLHAHRLALRLAGGFLKPLESTRCFKAPRLAAMVNHEHEHEKHRDRNRHQHKLVAAALRKHDDGNHRHDHGDQPGPTVARRRDRRCARRLLPQSFAIPRVHHGGVLSARELPPAGL